jgi:hypothetical protein
MMKLLFIQLSPASGTSSVSYTNIFLSALFWKFEPQNQNASYWHNDRPYRQ